MSLIFAILALCLLNAHSALGDDTGDDANEAVSITGSVSDSDSLALAIGRVPDREKRGVRFLIRHMHSADRESLSIEFLVTNTKLAYQALDAAPWHEEISDELFLNYVLPYANLDETRDSWRQDFFDRFSPLLKDTKSPTEAAVRLNQTMFEQLGVRYSTSRPKANQSPLESIESGTASCTGLSILLVDACRSIGIPARVVGTPKWADGRGNHTWVEIWDDGWHYTGAAEPTGDKLDQAWFTARAAQAKPRPSSHAIYAASFRKTELHFPLVWDRSVNWVPAVDVTARYTAAVDDAKSSSAGD